MKSDSMKGRKRLLTVCAAALAMGVLGSTVTASIPDSTTSEISGCYKNGNGALRVIDTEAGQQCKPAESPLSWNQIGP